MVGRTWPDKNIVDDALYELMRYWKVRALYYEALYRIHGGSADPFELRGSGETTVEERPGFLSGDGCLSNLSRHQRRGRV